MREVKIGEKIENLVCSEKFILRAIRNVSSGKLTIIGEGTYMKLNNQDEVTEATHFLEIPEENDYDFLPGKVADFYLQKSKEEQKAQKELARIIDEECQDLDVIVLIGCGDAGWFFLETVIKYVQRQVRLATIDMHIPFWNMVYTDKESLSKLSTLQRTRYKKIFLQNLDYSKLKNHIWVNFITTSFGELEESEDSLPKKFLLKYLNKKMGNQGVSISQMSSVAYYIDTTSETALKKALEYFKS